MIKTFCIYILFIPACFAQAFITTWKSDNSGVSASNQITIPGVGTNYQITWVEVGMPTNTGVVTGNGTTTVTFPYASTYQVSIIPSTGTFVSIKFDNGGDRLKLISIDQWGSISWNSFAGAFYGCSNMIYNASDAPNLTSVTHMNSMFNTCSLFNGDLSTWDVSGVVNFGSMFKKATVFSGDITGWNVSSATDFSAMFWYASAFNQAIGGWDVSGVQNFSSMFRNIAFNQDISSWNTSSATNMAFMFNGAIYFDQNISSWNVSNVTNMQGMFANAYDFNQDISSWDVSSVQNFKAMFLLAKVFNQNIGGSNMSSATDISQMFQMAYAFNQDISSWDVSGTNNFYYLFYNANAFNQNVGSWDISNVTNMDKMLDNSNLSSDNYDLILKGWAAQSVQTGVVLSATGLTYCDSETDRNFLITTKSWTISGDNPCPAILPIELSYFAPKIEKNTVLLNWTTELEIDNDYFTLQRSLDNKNWESIGRVEGVGYSSIPVDYQYTDNSPNKGINYYRLQQTDFDGSSTYSKAKPIYFDNSETYKIFPNPCVDYIQVQLNTTSLNHNYKVLNCLGQDMHLTADPTIGDVLHFNVQGIEKGAYYIQSENGLIPFFKF